MRRLTQTVMSSNRRSSFLDLESTSRLLSETEHKLVSTIEKNVALEKKNEDLSSSYASLLAKYNVLCDAVVNVAWHYCPQKCVDFKHLVAVDEGLSENERRFGAYDVLEVLGSGQFSVVKSCIKEGEEDMSLAVKMIRKDRVTSIEGILRIERELHALSLLSPHANIVEFKEVLHAKEHLYIVTEQLPMDMFDFLDSFRGKLNDNIAGVILKELLCGLQHMASHHVVHRDLKPENVLVRVCANEVHIKICDFGLSELLSNAHDTHLSSFCGSPGFFAPEALAQKSFCAYKADVFSIGCIALEMLTSQAFFNDTWIQAYGVLKTMQAPDFSKCIKHALEASQAEVQRCHAVDVSEFLIHALHLNPSTRASIATLRKSTWLGRVSTFLAADILNNKEPRKCILMPTTSSQQQQHMLVSSPSSSPRKRPTNNSNNSNCSPSSSIKYSPLFTAAMTPSSSSSSALTPAAALLLLPAASSPSPLAPTPHHHPSSSSPSSISSSHNNSNITLLPSVATGAAVATTNGASSSSSSPPSSSISSVLSVPAVEVAATTAVTHAAIAATEINGNNGISGNNDNRSSNSNNNGTFDLVSPSSSSHIKSSPPFPFVEQFVFEAKEVGGGGHGSSSYKNHLNGSSSSSDKTSNHGSLTPFASYNHALHAHVPHRHRKHSTSGGGGTGERGPGGGARLGSTDSVGGGGGRGGGSHMGGMSIPNRLVV